MNFSQKIYDSIKQRGLDVGGYSFGHEQTFSCLLIDWLTGCLSSTLRDSERENEVEPDRGQQKLWSWKIMKIYLPQKLPTRKYISWLHPDVSPFNPEDGGNATLGKFVPTCKPTRYHSTWPYSDNHHFHKITLFSYKWLIIQLTVPKHNDTLY